MARAYITITIATLLRNDYPWISTEAAEQLVRHLVPSGPSPRTVGNPAARTRYGTTKTVLVPVRRNLRACP